MVSATARTKRVPGDDEVNHEREPEARGCDRHIHIADLVFDLITRKERDHEVQDADEHAECAPDDGEHPRPSPTEAESAGNDDDDHRVDQDVHPGSIEWCRCSEGAVRRHEEGENLNRAEANDRAKRDKALLANAGALDAEAAIDSEYQDDGERVLDVGEGAEEEQADRRVAKDDDPRALTPRLGEHAHTRGDAGHGSAGGPHIELTSKINCPRPRGHAGEEEKEGGREDCEELADAEVGEGDAGSAPVFQEANTDEAQERGNVDGRRRDEECARDRRPESTGLQRRQPVSDRVIPALIFRRAPEPLADDTDNKDDRDDRQRDGDAPQHAQRSERSRGGLRRLGHDSSVSTRQGMARAAQPRRS